MATVTGIGAFVGSGAFVQVGDAFHADNTGIIQGDLNTIHVAGTGASNVFLVGDATGSIVYAGSGNDFISGGNGADHLFGGTGAGTSVLSGNLGNDVLTAGTGTGHVDIMSGGQGADTFVFNDGSGTHTVTDFSAALGDIMQLASNINNTGIVDSATLSNYLANNASQVGNNVVIDLHGGDTLQVNNANLADMVNHPNTYFQVV
jgi:Ca2+-binding RTX toxin-like protein